MTSRATAVELGNVGLADDDRTGSSESADDLGVGAARSTALVPQPVELAGDVGVVLDRDRHPGERE